jgi:hypothetical protein
MKSAIAVSVFLIFILSCSKKDDCKEEVISIKNLERDYGCQNTKYTLQMNLNDDVAIISTKESYDNVVSGNCHPDIDFSLYDLVIGKLSISNTNDTIKYELRRTCPGSKLTLAVDLIQLAVTQPSTIVYHSIIPKLGNEETLNIQLTYLYK